MKPGRAITEAMQAQKHRDERAIMWHCIHLYHVLQAFHWWGWDWRTSRVWDDHKPADIIHGTRCHVARWWGGETRCTCRLPRW
jgi:hypothetical protein